MKENGDNDILLLSEELAAFNDISSYIDFIPFSSFTKIDFFPFHQFIIT